jgi:hypothetical protein
VCPCASTSFPLSFHLTHHTPCRLRLAKIHKHKRLVKKYLLGKAKYLQKLARKAKYPRASAAHDDQSTAVFVSVVSSDSEVLESPSCNDTSKVPESPVRITPIKPMKPLVLSPNTCTKIADNKAAALARRAAVEASRKCAICTAILSVQHLEDLCAICTQAVDSSKADLEPEGHSREVTVAVAGGVKKENKLKKAVDSLKIDFEDKAIKITEDGSKKKKRLTKTRKVLDM